MPTYQKLKQTIIYLLAPGGALLAQSSPITETNFNAPVDFPAALKIAVERDPRLLGMETKRDAGHGAEYRNRIGGATPAGYRCHRRNYQFDATHTHRAAGFIPTFRKNTQHDR